MKNRELMMGALALATMGGAIDPHPPTSGLVCSADWDSGDDMGDDMGDDVGAWRRRRRPVRRANLAAQFRARTPGGGGSRRRDYLAPFPEGTFSATSLTLSEPQQPQKPFIGRRLVIDFGRVGTSATGMVRVTNLLVGVDPQFATTGNVPANTFAFNAVGTRLDLDGTEPGLLITLQTAIATAPTMTDTVLQSSTLIGPSVS